MVLHAEGAQVARAQALAAVVVQVHVRHFHALGQRGRVDCEAVVVARDLDPAPGVAEAHRLVAAVVPEARLVGAAAQRRAVWLAQADAAQTQPLAQQVAHRAHRSVTAAGSPGPFERNTPSGASASTSAAGVLAGTTVTRRPRSAGSRRMLRLMP